MPGMAGGGMAVVGGRVVSNATAKVTSIHKNTGKAVFDEKLSGNAQTNFFGVRLDPRANTVELLSPTLKITHFPDADNKKNVKPAAVAPGLDGAQAPVSRPKTAEKRVLRPALDRARIREIASPLPPG
jgi:hypothetical protein